MNYPTPQQYADLADDVYKTRQVTRDDKSINIGGNHYAIKTLDLNTDFNELSNQLETIANTIFN